MTWALMVDRGKRKGTVIPIRKFPFAMGRNDDCHLRAANPYVSHRHCELRSDGDRMIIRDCNSTNGTFINSLRVADEEVELHEGDRIKIGSLTFLVCHENPDAPISAGQEGRGPANAAPETSGPDQQPAPPQPQKIDEDSIGDMLLDLEVSDSGPLPGAWRKPDSPNAGSEKGASRDSGRRPTKNMRQKDWSAPDVASKMLRDKDVARLKPK